MHKMQRYSFTIPSVGLMMKFNDESTGHKGHGTPTTYTCPMKHNITGKMQDMQN